MNIKEIFDPHVSCRPSRVTTNQHNFKSGPIWIFFIKKDNDFINRRTNIFYGKQY